MTDREMLELAAKTAGIDATPRRAWLHKPPIGFSLAHPARIIHDGKEWNPLNDDGDALRLAVRLGIEIGNYHQYGRALASIGYTRGSGEFWEINPDDHFAATRRAIVRAAAEIGRNMG